CRRPRQRERPHSARRADDRGLSCPRRRARQAATPCLAPSPRSCRTLRQQAAEIGTAWLMRDEVAEVRDRRHRSLLHEDEALADLLEDFEVETLVGVDAEEHQPSLRAQPAEEVE